MKNEAILRDVLSFWSWQHQKRSELEGLVPMSFAIFPIHVSEIFALATKKWGQVIQSAAPVTQNHLPKTEDPMLQNATRLRKSALGPPNISDEHVSCFAPATVNASLRIFFKCPTPTPCACRAKRHLNVQKWSEHVLRLTFWLGNCFAPQRRALFRHLNFQKRSNTDAVHFLSISTSNSGPNMWCFYNGVQFFISHPTRWLRTSRFSEPILRPAGATNHWENMVIRDFSTLSRACIFFLLTLSLFFLLLL